MSRWAPFALGPHLVGWVALALAAGGVACGQAGPGSSPGSTGTGTSAPSTGGTSGSGSTGGSADCPSPRLLCNGRCIDPATDNDNCGGCADGTEVHTCWLDNLCNCGQTHTQCVQGTCQVFYGCGCHPNSGASSGGSSGRSCRSSWQASSGTSGTAGTSGSAGTTGSGATTPSAPSMVTTYPGDGQVLVSFVPPASFGDSPIQRYRVSASPGGVTATVSAPATTARLTGLSNGTPYTITVAAENAFGTGPPSAAAPPATPFSACPFQREFGYGGFTLPGGGLESAAVADFDGDGRLDLAASGGRVSAVGFGTGLGTFDPLPFGKGGRWLPPSDLDGDSRPDLVGLGGDQVYVVTIDGTRNLREIADLQLTVPGPLRPFQTGAVGDLNGDGLQDIVVVPPLWLLLGEGDGGFSTVYAPWAHGPDDVAVGDLDGDGRAEVVAASPYGLEILALAPDGGLRSRQSLLGGQPVTALALADLDADGRPDLAYADGQLGLLLQAPDGGFVPGAAVPSPLGTVTSLRAGDFDGDGALDLVARSEAGFVIARNDRAGGIASTSVTPIAQQGWLIDVGDLDGDGRLDVAYGSALASSAGVLYGRGDGTLLQPADRVPLSAPPTSLAIAPAAGGPGTIAAATGTLGLVTALPDGGWLPRADLSLQAGAQVVAPGDFDSDGVSDLAVLGDHQIAILRGLGGGSFATETDLALPDVLTTLLVLDADGDGRLDLVGSGPAWPGLLVLLGNGDGTFQPPGLSCGLWAGEVGQFAAADFDRDGHLDLVSSPRLYVWYGRGDGTFELSPDWSSQVGAGIWAGDLNADGAPDFVAISSDFVAHDLAAVFLGRGDRTFDQVDLSHDALEQLAGWTVADLDGDGTLELVIGRPTEIEIVHVDASGITDRQSIPGPGAPGAIAVADLDGDGRPDVAASSSSDPEVSVYLNRCR